MTVNSRSVPKLSFFFSLFVLLFDIQKDAAIGSGFAGLQSVFPGPAVGWFSSDLDAPGEGRAGTWKNTVRAHHSPFLHSAATFGRDFIVIIETYS